MINKRKEILLSTNVTSVSKIARNKDRSIDVTPFSSNTDPEINSGWIVLLMKPLKSSYGTGAKLTLLQVFRPTSMTAYYLFVYSYRSDKK